MFGLHKNQINHALRRSSICPGSPCDSAMVESLRYIVDFRLKLLTEKQRDESIKTV